MDENNTPHNKKNTFLNKATLKQTEIIVSLDKMMEQKLSVGDYLDQIECMLIVDAYKKCGENKTHAAELLGVNRTTLEMKYRKLRQFGIDPDQDNVKTKYGHLFK